jgi:hypothetical protein
MPPLETLIRHASGAIDLVHATGLVERTATESVEGVSQPVTRPGPRSPVEDRPVLTLDAAPRDLDPFLRAGRIVLLRRVPAAQSRVAAGSALEADLTAPAEADFRVAGQVATTSPAYNPRRFDLTAGGGARIALDMHLRPAAVRGAALWAMLEFDDGAPASWAIVTISIALGAGDPAARMAFRGQADRRGEVRVPLDGLPLPTPAALAAGTAALTATVTARALRAASGTEAADPDGFVDVTLRGPTALDFAASAQFQIDPARPAQLASFDGTATGDRLVLRQT